MRLQVDHVLGICIHLPGQLDQLGAEFGHVRRQILRRRQWLAAHPGRQEGIQGVGSFLFTITLIHT
jgi:hypothetical protein